MDFLWARILAEYYFGVLFVVVFNQMGVVVDEFGSHHNPLSSDGDAGQLLQLLFEVLELSRCSCTLAFGFFLTGYFLPMIVFTMK
jgi:hypothetical protein